MREECCFKRGQREVGQGKHLADVGHQQLYIGRRVARAARGALQLSVHERLQGGQRAKRLGIVGRLVAL